MDTFYFSIIQVLIKVNVSQRADVRHVSASLDAGQKHPNTRDYKDVGERSHRKHHHSNQDDILGNENTQNSFFPLPIRYVFEQKLATLCRCCEIINQSIIKHH